MKKLVYLLALSAILAGCKALIQVNETKSIGIEQKNGNFVYENDTLLIEYYFWAERGVLSFSVFNKLSIPIYIDWKKASFIYNSKKLDYWVDEEISSAIAYYGGYYYDGLPLSSGFSVSKSVLVSKERKEKIERITFIPPKSYYYRSQFYLLPDTYFDLSSNSIAKEVPRNDKPKKLTEVIERDFTKINSPLVFRNFITLSLSEEFNNEFYVNNEFYLSSVKQMDLRHFRYIKKNNEGKKEYFIPFKNGTSFYRYVPPKNDSLYWKNNASKKFE